MGRWAKIAQSSAELHRMCKVKVENQDPSAEAIGRLVALAYPERIALAMDHMGNYRLANGNRVRIESTDSLIGYQWLAVASMHSNGNAGKVFLAAPVCERIYRNSPQSMIMFLGTVNRDVLSCKEKKNW